MSEHTVLSLTLFAEEKHTVSSMNETESYPNVSLAGPMVGMFFAGVAKAVFDASF